jgi:hypothetical protein
MNRRIAFLALALTVLGACSSQTRPVDSGAGGSAEPDPAAVSRYEDALAQGYLRAHAPQLTQPPGRGRPTVQDLNQGGSGGGGGSAPEPSYCVDLLLTWVQETNAPAMLGPTSPATDQVFADLEACMAANCSSPCSGIMYATPPVSINGGPGSASCKACFVTPCLGEFGACVDDHDPADLCYGRGRLSPDDQTCVTAGDCVGFVNPACGLVCDPATGLDVGACWEYEERWISQR